MQYREKKKVSQVAAFDKIIELVPEDWRRIT